MAQLDHVIAAAIRQCMASSIGPDQWCVFCTPFAIFPHAVINLTQIWRI